MFRWMRPMAVVVVAAFAGLAHAQTAPVATSAPREVLLEQGQFEKAPNLPAWVDMSATVPKPSEPAPFSVLMLDTQFLASGTSVMFHRRATTATSNLAVDQLGRASFDFYPAFQRARWHVLRIIRDGVATDRLAQAKITFLQRETSLAQNLYTGVTTVNTVIDDVRPGDVVEMAYSIEGENPVFAGKYHANSLWDQPLGVGLRRLSLMHPPERKIEWKVVGDSTVTTLPDPVVSTVQGMRKLQWSAREVARTPVDPAPPPAYVGFKFVQFSEYGTWSDVNAWGQALFKSAPADKSELDARLAEFKAKPTPATRAMAAVNWVQDNIRYVSISIGESSHRPAQPDVTLRRRYGDCKDKSVLLAYFLNQMGIEAWPVLVASRSPQLPARTLPSPGAFDHVIVRMDVEGAAYFVDATRHGQGTNLQTLGATWANAQVFEMRPGNDKVTAIPPVRPGANREDIIEKFKVASLEGPAEVEVTNTVTGSPAEVVRVLVSALPKDAMQKALATPYIARYPGAEVVVQPTVTDDREANVVTITMKLKGDKLVTKAGDNWMLRFNPGAIATGTLLPNEGRVAPIAMTRFGVDVRYNAEAEWPPEVSAGRSLRTVTVKDDAFTATFNDSFRGNRATHTAELVVHEPMVPANQLKAYAVNARKVIAQPPFFLVAPSELKRSANASLREAGEQRARTTITNTTRAIDSGKLSGEDLAVALCARMSARATLQQYDQALNDGQAAVRANPESSQAFRCRGFAFFVKENYDDAIEDFNQAIALQPRPRLYYDRGRAKMYAGKLAEAAEDFRKAGVDAPGEANDKMYAEIWHVFTALKAGKPLPEASVKLAAASPKGEWPRPAIAMLHGLISVDDMYDTLKDRKGDTLTMNMLEADFYAAEHYLIKGDKAKAAELFRKTMGYGGVTFNEYHEAAMELKRLGMQ